MRLKQNLITIKPTTPRYITLKLLQGRENFTAENYKGVLYSKGNTVIDGCFLHKKYGSQKTFLKMLKKSNCQP